MENKSAVQLYLELLKKTILFEIWLEYEPYLPASLHISKELSYEPVTVPLPLFLKRYVENHNLKIVNPNVSNNERQGGKDWPRAAPQYGWSKTYESITRSDGNCSQGKYRRRFY